MIAAPDPADRATAKYGHLYQALTIKRTRKMTNRLRTSARLKPVPWALAVLLGTGMTGTMAQTTTQPASSTGVASEDKLETVIVSSQRRVERLQDVPVAVKAFSAKQIEDAGIKSTQDFINMTPNMSFDNSYTYGNSFVVIRGVTQINNADSPVAVVVDGVPQSDQKQLKMNLVDVERIEVLKGPQGALYGRNAIGGAIVIDTKAPKNEWGGFVKVGLSSGNSVDVAGGVSGALVPDRVLFRVVGNTQKSDGLTANTFLNKNVDALDHDNDVRAKLTVFATDDVSLDFRLSSRDFKAGGIWDSQIGSLNPNEITPITTNVLGVTTGTTDEFTFKAEVNTSIGMLTAITAKTNLKEKVIGDGDFSNSTNALGGVLKGIANPQRLQGQERDVRLLSQEIRLTSPVKQATRWIAGLFYLNQQRELLRRSPFDDGSGNTDQWERAPSSGFDRFYGTASAVFGQLDHDISPKTTISGALRYDRDDRNRTNLLTNGQASRTFDAWQPKITLTQRLGADSLMYGTYSTGFRSGGFNAAIAAEQGFRAETLQNYELGYKGSFLDNRFIFNAAGFISRSKDFQYFGTTLVNGNNVAQINNIDRVNIQGMDVDFRFTPARGLEFDGGIGVTDSRVAEDAAHPANVGNYTPKASPWKINLGTQYTARVSDGLLGFGRLDIEQRSAKYWHANNLLVSEGFTLLNARVGIKDQKSKWSLDLYAKNLTDKQYYADVNGQTESNWPNRSVVAIGSLAPRRTIGIEATYRM
jgi:iron complex outermembrane receptor protein